MKGVRKGLGNLKLWQWKLPIVNKRQNKVGKNVNRRLGTCVIIMKDLGFIFENFRKRKRKRRLKNTQTNGRTFPKFSERQDPTDSGDWVKSKQDKPKEITQYITVKLAKTKDKGKILKASKEKWQLIHGANMFNNSGFFTRSH